MIDPRFTDPENLQADEPFDPVLARKAYLAVFCIGIAFWAAVAAIAWEWWG